MNRFWISLMCVGVWAVATPGQVLNAPLVPVQAGALSPVRPVEQGVEDLDPLQVSLRRESTGQATLGERATIFRLVDPAGQNVNSTLYYMGQGYMATFDRSDYAITRKGNVIQLVAPNTVFRLDIPADLGQAAQWRPADIAEDDPNDRRLSTRMSTLLTGQAPQVAAKPGEPDIREMWKKYESIRAAQRSAVARAIDTVAPSASATQPATQPVAAARG